MRKFFDSIKNNKWNKSNAIVDGGAIKLSADAFCEQKISVFKGNIQVYLSGRKKVGDGKIVFSIKSESRTLFSKEIIFSSQLWSEHSFEFEADENEECSIILFRERRSAGSVEIGRLKIDSHTISKEDFLDTYSMAQEPIRTNVACIIPYEIYGGAEVYLKNFLHVMSDSFKITLYMFGENKIEKYVPGNVSIKTVKNIEFLKSALVANEYDSILFYNRADIYFALLELKKDPNFYSKLVEIYHSDFEWNGSLSRISEREQIQMISVSESLGKKFDVMREIIPISIDIESYHETVQNEKLRKLLKRNGEILIGTIARLSPEKNLEYLFELAAKLPKATFVVFGDGPLMQSFKSKNAKNVYFEGFADNVAECLKTFDAFVLPSKMEGTPISIIEAMASGVPVFVSKVGAIPDVVSHGETGWFLSMNAQDDASLISAKYKDLSVTEAAYSFVVERNDVYRNVKKLESILSAVPKSMRRSSNDIVLNGFYI